PRAPRSGLRVAWFGQSRISPPERAAAIPEGSRAPSRLSITEARHPGHAAAFRLDHQQDLAAPGRGLAQDRGGAGDQGLDDFGAAGAADAEEGEEVRVRRADIVVGVVDDGAGGEQVVEAAG